MLKILLAAVLIAAALYFLVPSGPDCHPQPSNPNMALDAIFCED